MTVPLWYIRERCPTFAYLPPQEQQNWMLLLSAEFYSPGALSAVGPRDRVYPRENAAAHVEPAANSTLEMEGWSITLTLTLTPRPMESDSGPL